MIIDRSAHAMGDKEIMTTEWKGDSHKRLSWLTLYIAVIDDMFIIVKCFSKLM